MWVNVFCAGCESVCERQLYDLAVEVSSVWREVAVSLGMTDEMVTFIERDSHTAREQSWIMLKHYVSMTQNRNVHEAVYSNLHSIKCTKNFSEAESKILHNICPVRMLHSI